MADVLPGTERAGGMVEAEYRRALKSWRRRVRRYHWPLIAVGVALLTAGLLVHQRAWTFALASTGGFLLESKAWWGRRLEIGPGGVTLTGIDSGWSSRHEDSLTRSMTARSAAMNQALRELVKVSPRVTPVVVVWCEFPEGEVEHQGVWFVHGGRIATWLESRPERLSPSSLEKLRRVLGTT